MTRFFMVAALLALGTAPLSAQSFHTLSSARQPHGERELNLEVEFVAGRFSLSRDSTGALYRSRMSYNEDRFRPVADFDEGDLRLGLKSVTVESNFNLKKHEYDRQFMDLTISPTVPARLNLHLAAGESRVDLGGLNLRSAEIHTGASKSRFVFSSPTVGNCESLSFQVGAAEFRAEQLGNARCQAFDFAGGAGDLTLDFTGNWGSQSVVNADIKMGVGTLQLNLPRDIGVQVEMSRFLSSFDDSGFVKKGDTYYSRNWDSAKSRLHIDITTALGNIEVAWEQ